jgi:GrpB-like predicted nucleotidyltransferase (UPF0157 family)
MEQRHDRRRPDVTTVEIVGGPEAVHVGLEPYDEGWPAVFAEHHDRIRRALGPGTSSGVEHIGSTAVPGLAAKPIIDVLVTVDDITAEEDHVDRLLAAGYVLRVREPGHRLVRTPERTVHVHVYEHDAPAVEEYRLFRDRLRADAADRALYEDTKRELFRRQWDDMNDYADAKTEVIEAIRARARAALPPQSWVHNSEAVTGVLSSMSSPDLAALVAAARRAERGVDI